MQNSIVMFTFFVFGRKYPVWDNLVQKIKIISWSWNLVPILIRICRIEWWYSLFLFLIGNTLLGQIWSKLSIFTVQGETDTLTNSIIQKSMAEFTFFFFDQKHSFWVNLVQNVKIVSLRLNFVASIGILKSHTHQQEYHQPSVDGTC